MKIACARNEAAGKVGIEPLAHEHLVALADMPGDQRFFLGWAEFFRIKPRDKYLRQTMLTWRHSPDMLRAWTVRNIDARYEAFDVKPGDKLYLPPEERVKIW